MGVLDVFGVTLFVKLGCYYSKFFLLRRTDRSLQSLPGDCILSGDNGLSFNLPNNLTVVFELLASCFAMDLVVLRPAQDDEELIFLFLLGCF